MNLYKSRSHIHCVFLC